MRYVVEDINNAIYEEFWKIKDLPDIDLEIEKIFREIRWKEPELAIYVKKKLKQYSKEKGNP